MPILDQIRVVAAAVLTSDGLVHTLPPPARHHNIVYSLARFFDHPSCASDEQGFLLSDGSFCLRRPAKIVARAANQLLSRASELEELFSEDVW